MSEGDHPERKPSVVPRNAVVYDATRGPHRTALGEMAFVGTERSAAMRMAKRSGALGDPRAIKLRPRRR